MTYLLQAIDIKKKFDKTVAVAGISLQVKAGECVALLGPNGAGKTTTVEMLEGLLEPDHGSVSIFGKSLKRDREAILQEMGVVLQETRLYKKYTVRETFDLFGSFYKNSVATDTIITRLNLEEKADARLESLSGGQRQRVYLGCGLINDPRLLFLDEPTTGLDPQARRMIWDLMIAYKGSDRGILLTTHYMDEAEKLADRVLIVDKGKIIAEGTPRELIHKVCGEQVLTFAFSASLEERHLRDTLGTELSWMKEAIWLEGSFEVVTTTPVALIQELYQAVKKSGLELANLEMRRATLEDVFIKLTGRSIRDD